MIKRRPTINGPENRKGVRKINEAKSYSFFGKKKINAFEKSPARLEKEKKNVKRHKLPVSAMRGKHYRPCGS